MSKERLADQRIRLTPKGESFAKERELQKQEPKQPTEEALPKVVSAPTTEQPKQK